MKDNEKPDLSRTSAYVRAYIERLEGERDRAVRDRDAYVADAAVGIEDSTVVADPYSGCPRPLGNALVRFGNERLRFYVEFSPASDTLEVRVEGTVARNDGIAVYPHSSNNIRIKGGRP